MVKEILFVIVLLSITLQGVAAQAKPKTWTDELGESFSSVFDNFNYEYFINKRNLTSDNYDEKRAALIKEANEDYFTFDVPELTEKEQRANDIIQDLREQVVQGDHSPLLLPYYEGKKQISESNLHQAIRKMPKGAHLRLHQIAAYPLDFIINVTYKDDAYYNIKENRLSTFSNKAAAKPGFHKCNFLRKNWKFGGTFDSFLRSKILITEDELKSQEHSEIWKSFRAKFYTLEHLFREPENIRAGLLEICKRALKDGVYIVEFRRSLRGNITQKLENYQYVQREMKKIDPAFEIALIVSSTRDSKAKAKHQLDVYNQVRKTYPFVIGFDFIGTKDALPSIYSFKDLILDAMNQDDDDEQTENDFNLFFHAGETTDRYNEELYDAILLGVKRIGHGFGTLLHPRLIDKVIEEDIGIEICPISNLVLGYILDMRWHPIRTLMNKGVSVTISSDDPTLFGYDNLSLDFTYGIIAWQLDLKDLKQLALNSIKQSSIHEDLKTKVYAKFYKEWENFIDSLNVSC
ncbi:unnamed protein product [Moneuplotes crassus]|uniref:Adenosine deaminase domain-containing protein n=1 Tax=Euplotes crassus TaxID=5936 RepID=A0AAD1UGD8_EUPCR|nr:unnamed protein product [Moneuplotes crassus]